MQAAVRIFALIVMVFALTACDGSRSARNANGTGQAASASPSYRIAGQVKLERASDWGGVQVYVPGTSLISITDQEGLFTLENITAGSYQVMARMTGYRPVTLGQVDIEAAAVNPVYTLEPVTLPIDAQARQFIPSETAAGEMGSIRGRVSVTGDGVPATDLSQCVIELEGSPYRTVCTSTGEFLLWRVPADNYNLLAHHPGHQPLSLPLRILPGEKNDPLQLTLEPLAVQADCSIQGQVLMVDLAGNLTQDFDSVVVQVIGRPGLEAVVEADGSFSLSSLTPGRYMLMAQAAGYAMETSAPVDLSQEKTATVQMTLLAQGPPADTQAQAASLSGQIIKNDQPEGTDMSGITVALSGTSLVALSDPRGNFTIANIPPGTYSLLAQAEGFQPTSVEDIELTSSQLLKLDPIYLEPKYEYPKILMSEPADGSSDIPIQREIPISVRFSKKMEPESLRDAVTIDPPVAFTVYAGRDLPQTDFDLMLLVISGAVDEPVAQFKTRYTIIVNEKARDFEGLNLQEPYTFSITTGEPAVVATLPADGEIKKDLSPRTPVVIYFNAEMDPKSLGEDALRIRPELEARPHMTVQNDPDTGWSRLYIGAAWKPDTQYEVQILRRAKTSGRGGLSNTPYAFKFRTTKVYSPNVNTGFAPAGR